MGPSAVLSHWSAAALWKIRPNSRSLIDVTTPHKSRSWDGIKRHHKALPPDEVTVKDGIPVTTVPRTIFDLAATEDVDTIAAMLRESEHLNLWDRLSLPHLIERYPGRRGVKKVRLAVQRVSEEPTGRKRSKLEERFAPFLRRHRPAAAPLQRLDPARRQALPGGLPLARHRPDSRARRLGKSRHPLRLPRRQGAGPKAEGGGVLGNPPHLESTA
jgi:hypothetical protein